MKKSLLAILVAGILLLTASAFAGTITIGKIPSVIVVNDGGGVGETRGDDNFTFSEPFDFSNYVGLDIPGSSTEPITLSYYVTGETGTIDSEAVVTIEGVAHGTAVDGSGNTTPVVLGEMTALDADGVLLVEFSGITTYSSGTDYDKSVILQGESADTNPGEGPAFQIIVEGDNFSNVDRFSADNIIFDYGFTSGAEGWVFSPLASDQIGSSTEGSTGGELTITYDTFDGGASGTCWSFWRKGPDLAPVFSWEQDTLYVVDADISGSVLSTDADFATGGIPDFRLWSGDDKNDAMSFRLISSQPSDGGSGYISPLSTGTSYKWVIEANVMASSPNKGMMQFEGFANDATRNPLGKSVGMQSIRLSSVPGFDTTAAGTTVGSISGSAMAPASAEWQWVYVNSGSATIPELTSGSTTGALTMTYPAAADTNLVYYGSWVTNPYASPTASMTFAEQTLYKAAFNVSTANTNYGAYQNHILALCQVRSKDAHVATAAARFSQNGTTVPLDASGVDVNVWWYYEGATRGGGWDNELMFAFDGTAGANSLTTSGNVISLNSITVTEHGALPAY